MLLINKPTDGHCLGLSIEILYTIIAQRAVKLPESKVWFFILHVSLESNRKHYIFSHSNFDLCQFCNSLSYNNVKYLIESLNQCPFGSLLVKSVAALLRYVMSTNGTTISIVLINWNYHIHIPKLHVHS